VSRIIANGIDIHYWRVGSGPDVVMLHGLTGNLAIWHLKLVPMLRKHFRTTTYDLRGHGRTEMPPTGYTTGDMAEDLRGLMDALEIEEAYLLGHSLGADTSLHFALRYPHRVKKMVLLEAGIPALVSQRKDADWEGWSYWAALLEEFSGIPVPPEKRNDIRYMVRQTLEVPIVYGPAAGLPRKKEPILRLLDDTTMVQDYEVVGDLTLENLATIPHPKLLIYDGQSPYLGTYHALRELLMNCQPILLPPSEHRHFSPLEQPEVLLGYILDFLEASPGDPADSSDDEGSAP
jgi:pimeloyl-ACP methyl ester carboxylesterase